MTIDPKLLQEIAAERVLQRAEWSEQHDRAKRPADWIAIISRHIGLAVNDGGSFDLARYRRQLIRLAALSIAAVENLDYTLPPKEYRVGTVRTTETHVVAYCNWCPVPDHPSPEFHPNGQLEHIPKEKVAGRLEGSGY